MGLGRRGWLCRVDGRIGRRDGEGVVELSLWVRVLGERRWCGSRVGVGRLGRGEDGLDAQLGSNCDGGLGLAKGPPDANTRRKAFPGHTHCTVQQAARDRSAVAMRAREGRAETRRSVGVVGRSASERTKYAHSGERCREDRWRQQKREQGQGQHSRRCGGLVMCSRLTEG
jgi:hypothetical protein